MANNLTLVAPASAGGFPLGTKFATLEVGGSAHANITAGGQNSTQVTVSASVTVVSASKGHLSHAVVTAVGAAQMDIYDNASAASGTILGSIPANAPVGYKGDFNMAATAGITCSGSASNPRVTLSWS